VTGRDLDREKLAKVLDQLPEAEKLVVTLAYFEGLADSEIAVALGDSEARVLGFMKALYRLAGRQQFGRAFILRPLAHR
jgi:RNA polymerase sigma factor for flagellar operon FliA